MSAGQCGFDGRVILVCGVARGGIGGATARRLAALGATVFGVDRTERLLADTLADIGAAGGRGDGLVADLVDPGQSDGIVDAVIDRFGRLDGVANIVGGTREGEWGPLEQVSAESFRQTVALNLEAPFRICRDAARSMIARKSPAPIVNVGSISALNSAPLHGPYGAAKAGLAALTRTMAFEWARHGIRVNLVSPGAVPTERVTAKKLTPDLLARYPRLATSSRRPPTKSPRRSPSYSAMRRAAFQATILSSIRGSARATRSSPCAWTR